MATPTCESCGAGVEPSHLACPFCKAVTPFGLRHREEEERARWAQQAANAAASQRNDAQARGLAEAELGRLGRLSAVWSAIGFLFFCAPVPSIVSLVLAYRARVVARENKFVLPAQATIGFLLSVVTLLLSVSFYSFAGLAAVRGGEAPSAPASGKVSPAVVREQPAPHTAPAAPTHHGEPGVPAPKGAPAAGHAGATH